MHEIGIAQSLFKLINKKAAESNAKKVIGVTVSVGRFSAVEPDLLHEAFRVLKKEAAENEIAKDASLQIQIVPLKILCPDCGCTCEIDELNMICSECHSSDTQVLSGQDIMLTNMELSI